MKTKLITIFLALVVYTNLWAQTSGTCGNNLTWTLQDSVLTISGVGNMWRERDVELIWRNIKNAIAVLVIEEGVTSVSEDAFSNCTNLTSISISGNRINIDRRAFGNCNNLTTLSINVDTLYLGEGVFRGCGGISSITISGDVVRIKEQNFLDCPELRYISLSADSLFIYDENFWGCSSLESILVSCRVLYFDDSHIFRGYNNSVVSTIYTTVIPPSFPPRSNQNKFPGKYYVPCGSIDIYKNEWPQDSNRIDYAPIQYSIFGEVNHPDYGHVTIPATMCEDTIVTAIPNYGYHFVQWMDSVTDNPRSITLIQDTTFVADFAKNSYNLTVTTEDSIRGYVNGSQTAEYLDTVIISASPNYGYHFDHWNDGDTLRPRQIVLTQDTAFTAIFAKNKYQITTSVDTIIHGTVSGAGSYDYLSERTLTATPNYGYHFTQWSDGETANPRTITLTQDSIFKAFFVKNEYTMTVSSADTVRGSTEGGQTVEYLDTVTITATANYGYHFTRWSDGNTSNPRSFALTRDMNVSAIFAKNKYQITTSVDTIIHGTVSGAGLYDYLSERTLTATPNYGYHFTQWSDGITENPRVITLTQDTAFKALYAKNEYTIAVSSADTVRGRTEGGQTVEYLDTVTITATANYGYLFTKWSDGNRDNPRTFALTRDMSISALFDKNEYSINCHTENGVIRGITKALYLDAVTLTAVPNFGYHFVQWSDSVTDNPRVFTLTKDTSFYAEMAQTFSGQCGDSLYWRYENNLLSFFGHGEMYNYTANNVPWLLLRDSIQAISFAEGMTSIGENALSNLHNISSINLPSEIHSIGGDGFSGCSKISRITIPNSVVTLGVKAFSNCVALDTLIIGTGVTEISDQFNGCSNLRYLLLGQNVQTIERGAFFDSRRLNYIVCHAQQPPLAYPDEGGQLRSFYNVHALVLIPCDNFSAYQHDALWGSFDLQCLTTDSGIATDGVVTVAAGDAEATFTWPTSTTADSYTLQITKDDEVFCTLTFNASGQLRGIAFAPKADGSARQVPSATLTTNGMTFQVTGLDYASHYNFSFNTKDISQNTIFAYSGRFSTNGTTAVDAIPEKSPEPRKIWKDGNLDILLPDGTRFDATGKKVE